jgi:hypothetical protein
MVGVVVDEDWSLITLSPLFPPKWQSPEAIVDPTGRYIEGHRNPESKFWFHNFSEWGWS